MFGSATAAIIVFIIVCTLLILFLVGFVAVILYRYQQKQHVYYYKLEELKTVHENARLQSQLEMQEQTFQHISREIHDNIGQKLTLAKLQLNTFSFGDQHMARLQLNEAVNLISESINDLSDISRSMSSDIVLNNGLIKALENEKTLIEKPGHFDFDLQLSGEPVFLTAEKELVIFRIAQEALNNIVKHAAASAIMITLQYDPNLFTMEISDNGRGFNTGQNNNSRGTGLHNMVKRAVMQNGNCSFHSIPGMGTTVKIEIPI